MQANAKGYPEITPYGDRRGYPLSFQQERVLYLHSLSDEGPLWNRISCKWLLGELDVRILKGALDALVERHSALRARITVGDGGPRQTKGGSAEGVFQEIDISGQSPGEREARAHAILNEEYEKPMSLRGGALFKIVHVRLSETEHWLILKLHHIISDATTLRILWNDLKALYNGEAGALRPLPVDSFDYAQWVREHFGEAQTRPQEEYWLRQFEGALPSLDLPTDRPAPAGLSFSGAIERQALTPDLIKRLQSFSLERRAIPFSTLLSAYYLLLHHYCRQDDLVIGTVFSGRHYSPKLNAVAGFFANTVALRARLDAGRTVEQMVKDVHALVTGAHDMQDYPFERLVDRLHPEREHKQNPLFRVLFNMVSETRESRTFNGIRAEEWREPEISATQVDLFLDVHMVPDGSELRVEYNTDLFRPTTIRRLLRHYLILLEKMLDSPGANAFRLGFLDEVEEKRVLSFGEGPVQPAPFVGIAQMLEERAARTPRGPALLHAGQTETCEQVNWRVNQLAAALGRAGVGAGDTVAVLLDRSPQMVISLFAILKAGAAYVPIDPSLPRQRIDYILQDSGARCLLVAGERAPSLGDGTPRVISVDRELAQRDDGVNPGLRTDPAAPAYVIYTSGSTGKPKGVVVTHGALMNTLRFLEARFPHPGKTFLLKTHFTFDVSTAELFGWLFDEGKLAVLEPGGEKDPARLLAAIGSWGVTHVNFVPSMLDALLAGLDEQGARVMERLRYVFVAGEAIQPELVERFHRRVRNVRLENLYGPTEAAVYATWHSFHRGSEKLDRVPIGRPLANTRAYILDENLDLVPVGLTGELCLSGAGLARGYLNAPELTDAAFCPNPYWKGERLYRTGDLAQWDEDGLIQFIGRADGQVKIRGFRIELGEVERKLRACSGVAEVAVTTRVDSFGQKGLVAYLVWDARSRRSLEDIRTEMASWLPGYMLPEAFVELERLPRLASGKVDFQTLAKTEVRPAAAPQPAPAAPVTELERTVITIAETLLNTSGLDTNSNFFHLGGNSLLTLRFIAALDEALGTHLSVIDFLSLPTLGEIAQHIEASGQRAPRAVAQGR